MQIISTVFALYIFLGFIYGVYVTIWGDGVWYMFPVNVLGGPIVAVSIIYRAIKRKKFYL